MPFIIIEAICRRKAFIINPEPSLHRQYGSGLMF